MRYFYDTEFLEQTTEYGRLTLDVISIGVVAEDGREYYAVNANVPWQAVMDHEWLRDNVVPHLPTALSGNMGHVYPRDRVMLDHRRVEVKPAKRIAGELLEFIIAGEEPERPNIELWAWYAAYDHVALTSLFGSFAQYPAKLPKHTNDLKQEVDLHWANHRFTDAAAQPHHALSDARWLRNRFVSLTRDRRPAGASIWD